MSRFGRRKELTLPWQFLFLKGFQIHGDGGISNRKLIWRFRARPSQLSREYFVRLEYKLGASPEAFVERPDLQLLAGNREIPHVFRNPLRLCLYLPWSEQWTPQKRIDQTIVPWIYTWLYYFEDWLAFGEWRGSGRHPGDESERSRNRKQRRVVASKLRTIRNSRRR